MSRREKVIILGAIALGIAIGFTFGVWAPLLWEGLPH